MSDEPEGSGANDQALGDGGTTATAPTGQPTAEQEPVEQQPAGQPAAEQPAGGEAALHRRWGVQLFNRSWELMDRADRTPDDDAELVHTAHASLYHWLQLGTPANAARGEWLCARVYSVLGRGEPARYHAGRVLDICRRNGIGDWDLAFAYEALARAYAVSGDEAAATSWLAEARAAADDIVEDDERQLLLADLQTVPTGQAGQAGESGQAGQAGPADG